MSPEQALAHMLDCRLSKNSYQLARNTFVEMKNPGYPPYNIVVEAIKLCYPENISVMGHVAKVLFQSLCNHTAERLCKYLVEVIDSLSCVEHGKFILYFKYGSDGSSSQSNYKQKFIDEDGNPIDDSSVYVTSFVPLQLVTVTENGNVSKVIWTNDKPSSPMYCRPVSVKFAKETTEFIIQEQKNLKEQIDNIIPHTFNISSAHI